MLDRFQGVHQREAITKECSHFRGYEVVPVFLTKDDNGKELALISTVPSLGMIEQE